MPEPTTVMPTGDAQAMEPTRQRAPYFKVNGVEIGAQEIINEGNARRSSFTPQAIKEKAGSDIDVRAAMEQDTRQADPVTSWFAYGPMDPETFETYKSYGTIDQFEEAFARKYSQWKPQTVEDYMKMGDTFVQATPELASFIKRRMLEAMPANLKAEYEEKAASAKAKRQMIESLKLQEFARKYQSEGLPDGWEMGGDGKPVPTYKAQEAEMSSRIKLASALGNLERGMRALDDFPEAKASIQREMAALSAMLKNSASDNAEPGTNANTTEQPVQVSDKAMFDKLPSGSLFIAPDGTTRRKP